MSREMTCHSYSLSEALECGMIICERGALIDPSVRIIPLEDNGESFGTIRIGANTKIRAGAILCSGIEIGEDTVIGHHVVIRSRVKIGASSLISHMTCVERNTTIGHQVRISALTHLTGGCLIEDDVQIGARVATVNDREMNWKKNPNLHAPIFRKGCRVGSGSTIMGGAEIGTYSFVGAHSLITKSVPPSALVIGAPAYIVRWLRRDEELEFDIE